MGSAHKEDEMVDTWNVWIWLKGIIRGLWWDFYYLVFGKYPWPKD